MLELDYRIFPLLKLHRFAEVISILREKLERDPQEYWYHYLLGRAYAGQKDYPKAIQFSLSAIKLDPENAWAYYLLSLIYQHMQKVEDELKMANEAASRDPIHSAILVRLAYAQLHCGKTDSAINIASDIITREPDNIEVHELLGDLCFATNKYTAAESHYREALKYQMEDVVILNAVARSLAAQQRWWEAIDVLAGAYNLAPDNENLQANLFDCINNWLATSGDNGSANNSLSLLPNPLQDFYSAYKRR